MRTSRLQGWNTGKRQGFHFSGSFCPASCRAREVTHILKSKSRQLTTAMFPWNFSELCLNYRNFPKLVISLKMKYLPHLCEMELSLCLFSRIYFSTVPWNIWHSLGPWQRRDQLYPFQISLWLFLVVKQTKEEVILFELFYSDNRYFQKLFSQTVTSIVYM